jgi:diguanylate cyclase (GGDEF)-like protein
MTGEMTPSAWATHQLADFLAAISQTADQSTTLSTAVERAAEAFEAEVGAVVRGGKILRTIGMPGGDETAILAAAEGRARILPVPGAGDCRVAVASCDRDSSTRLLVARSGEDPFTAEERGLLRSMMRVLSLTMQNLQLVGQLRERQALLGRLSVIQRSISHRAEIEDILGAVTQGLVELLDSEVALVRLVDPDDPDRHVIVSQHGLPEELVAAFRQLAPTSGIGGHAMARDGLVVADNYPEFDGRLAPFVDFGVVAMMAAPVHEGGRCVGAIVVGTRDPKRRYTEGEREALLAFAEHTSLALTDAEALAGMRRALYDPLTKLPNRAYFTEQLEESMRELGDAGKVAVLFIDIDRFKAVNDSMGHSAGDELLMIAAERISGTVRPEDVVARMGGDEFTVLIRGITHAREAEAVAERISEALSGPMQLQGREVVVSASIGLAFDDAADPLGTDLVHAADTAMYDAKSRGRGGVRTYRKELGERARRRLDVETALRSAVEQSKLTLHYQPLVDLQGRGGVSAVEALLRWEEVDRPAITVPEIISVAEDSGLIHRIGAWAIEEACRQHREWRVALDGRTPSIHVNLSGHQLRDPAIVTAVASALARTDTQASALTLEITESVLIGNDAHSREALSRLRELGVHLSLDDFGQGYSSLAYLADLDIQSLKIDRSFVQRLTRNDSAGVIVHHLISMAQQLGMSVVAEGTETAEQVERLRLLGSDLAQGYLFSKPVSATEITSLLTARTALGRRVFVSSEV